MPRGILHTNDGAVAYSAYRLPQWRKLAALLGEPFNDPKYDDWRTRGEVREQIIQAMEQLVYGCTTAEVMDILTRAGVPCERCHDLANVARNEGLIAAGSLCPVQVGGRDGRLFTSPVQKYGAAANLQSGYRGIGQDTIDVLVEHGVSHDRLRQLVTDGVIRVTDAQVSSLFAE